MENSKVLKSFEKRTSETSGKELKKKVSSKRWEIAQKSEEEYWTGYMNDSLIQEEAIRHSKKSKILFTEWSRFIKIGNNTRILQVGIGPEDIINYFPAGKRYAVDPLADFYKKKFKLDYGELHFLNARGEKLPFKDQFFDIVVLANVLDHVESPEKVLSEIKRVLKDNGIFHFENLFYQKSFIRIAKVWGKLKEIFTGKLFNIHHPFMFTVSDLRTVLSKYFSIKKEELAREIACYNKLQELKKIKLKDKSLKVRLLAMFNLYGTINYIAICKKSRS